MFDPIEVTIRTASREDVPIIVALNNAGGTDGYSRSVLQNPLPEGYFQAFDRIIKSPNDRLMVAEYNGKIIGTFHLTYLTYIQAMGQLDAQVESVHVHPEFRGCGLGTIMMTWVINQAKEKHCRRVQLTSNKLRQAAHRFYQKLGFEASHEGMKLSLGI